ncbi:MAG: small multi-drug export protein [Candidatus Diapherotrites archaeon]
MSPEQIVYLILITIVPWIELRGAIPAGILMGMDPLTVFLISVVTNILVIFPIYIFLELIFPYFESLPIIQPILAKIRGKTGKYVDKYGFLGLLIFTAIPLPGSGAYSACLGAHLLKIRKRDAIPAIALGVIVAGILVTLISIGFFKLFV